MLVAAWLTVGLAGTVPGLVLAQTVLVPQSALVRIAQASPDAPALDVYVDDQLLVADMVFGSVSEYRPIETGDHTLQVVPAGGDPARQALVALDISFDPETLQLVAVQNYLNALALSVFPEDVSAIDSSGLARIRMIHLVPDGNDLNLLQSDGSEVIAGVVPLSASQYQEIQAGSQSLSVRAERQDQVVTIPVSLALLPNVAYDLIVIGQVSQNSVEIVPLVTATAQPCGQFLAISGPEAGCLRFVNASPNIPSVDVYVGDDPQPVATGLTFGVVSPVISIPNAETEIRVVPSGSQADAALATTTVFADSGAGLLLVASGSGDHAKLDRYDDLNGPLGGQQARISVIHQASDAGTVDISANSQPLVRAILETEQSEDRLIPSGSYVFDVTSNADGQLLGRSTAVRIEAGTSYEIILIGDPDNGLVAIVVTGYQVPVDTALPAP